MKVILNGRVMEIEDSYALRLIEQNRAALPTADMLPKPKRAKRKPAAEVTDEPEGEDRG